MKPDIGEEFIVNAPCSMTSRTLPVAPALHRLLLTIDAQKCPFGCTYCFSGFADYPKPPSVEDITSVSLEGIDIVYPACDVDLFARTDAVMILRRVIAWGRHISISTKAHIRPALISELRSIASELKDRNCIIKIGVSISTKYYVSKIEPRTPSYASRVRSLARLSEAGIPTVLVLRPLLPELSEEEHKEVLEECRQYTDLLLIGPEYLDGIAPRDTTPREPPRDLRQINRGVGWTASEREWSVRTSPAQVSRLIVNATRLGYATYDSDLALMDFLISGRDKRLPVS